MTTFRVGQRVRIVWLGGAAARRASDVLGREGTITAIPSAWHPRAECDVEIDGAPAVAYGYEDRPWAALFVNLAPLTDPKADAFIESVKKWKPEPVAPALPAKIKERQ